MIRILHVTAKMDRGGIETFIMNIYRNINREKFQFDFLLSSDKEDIYNDEIRSLGGKIFKIPGRNKGVIQNKKAVQKFFLLHPEYKIVHQHVSSLSYLDPLKIAKKNGVATRIIHSHNTKQGGSSLHKYVHYINKFFISSIASHYFACSHLAARWLYPSSLYDTKKYRVIKNAIDTKEFVYNEELRTRMRKDMNIENKFVIGHIGRFMPQKNHDFLIDIFKKFNDKEKDSLLLLVGDGTLRKSIKEKVESLGLKDKVIFTGVRTDTSALLQTMDVFVMPSFHEGLPVTLIEAQAAGLPCVVSTEVTKEVQISQDIKWCGLNESLESWTTSILASKENVRKNVESDIFTAGYDTSNVVLELEKFYSDNYVK